MSAFKRILSVDRVWAKQRIGPYKQTSCSVKMVAGRPPKGIGPFSSAHHHMSAPVRNVLISTAPANKFTTSTLAFMCTCQEREETTRQSDNQASVCDRAAVMQRDTVPNTHTLLYFYLCEDFHRHDAFPSRYPNSNYHN